MKTSLKCQCGQKVSRRDVMHQGIYTRHYGPNVVYIKFRCSYCKKLGEHYIKHEDWEESLLQENSNTEQTSTERIKFDKMGPISPEEVKAAHIFLEHMDKIPDLLKEENI